MTEISRRRVTAGAAWTVPVILIGAAAPLAAASACPTLDTPVTVTGRTTGSATVRLTFQGVGASPYIFNVTSVSGVDFTGPTGAHTLTSPLSLTFTRSNNSNASGTVTVSYTIQPFQGSVCGQGTFTFVYSRP